MFDSPLPLFSAIRSLTFYFSFLLHFAFRLFIRPTSVPALLFFFPRRFFFESSVVCGRLPLEVHLFKSETSSCRQLRRLAFLDRSHNLTPGCLAGSCCVEVVVPRCINNSRRLSRRSGAQASRHPFHPSSPRRLSSFPFFSFISQKSRLRLTFDHPPWEPFAADKSRVSSLLCDNSAAEKGHVFPANRAVCASKYVVRRRRKPHLSAIHNCKIAPHLLIIAFFRFKGTAFQKNPASRVNMRDAAVAAINFSLSLMKGLIRQANLSASFSNARPPFSETPVEERGPCAVQNGTIYNA